MNLVQRGIGGGPAPRPGVKVGRGSGTMVLTIEDTVMMGIDKAAEIALDVAWSNGARDVLLSFGVDSLDAGFVPGTGWPEPGGLLPREVLRLLRLVAREGLCGMEVVEVAPQYGVGDKTALIGARSSSPRHARERRQSWEGARHQTAATALLARAEESQGKGEAEIRRNLSSVHHLHLQLPMKTKSLLLALTAALLVVCGVRAADPIKIGYSDWPGWGAWEIAKEKGLFKKRDVDVQFVWFPVDTDSLTALNTARIDVNCSAWCDVIAPLAEGVKLKVVLVNDNSAGKDATIGKAGITSIIGLKGKTVATEFGTVEHFMLLRALAMNGMTEEDIEFKNLTVPDAAAAFIAGKVDAAGVWQPWINQIQKEGKGSVLFTSKEIPGLVPDLLLSAHERTTILFVTRDLEEAVYFSTRTLVFSPRPGRIIKEIKVPFGAGRPLSLRAGPEFAALKRELLDLLRVGQAGTFDHEALLRKLCNGVDPIPRRA